MKIDELSSYNSDKIYDYIGDAYNVSLNMRKVKKLSIEEDGVLFPARPQQHIMLIAPFGSFKSTILKKLNEVSNGDVLTVDEITIPALLGTITKESKYIEGVLSKVGGKILGIDEWDSVSYIAQNSLLSPLENQRISKQIMFTVKEPIIMNKITTGNDFIDMIIQNGSIYGKIQFTCFAMSMDFNMRSKKQYALGSRFRMIRLNITESEMKKVITGILNFKFIDRNQIVENVLVKKNTWLEYIDAVYKYLSDNTLFPPNDMLGYVNRSIHDGLRDVIGRLIVKDPISEYIIDDSTLLINNIDNVVKQIQMYTTDVPVITKLKELYKIYPNMGYKFYCDKLNISPKHFYSLRDIIESGEIIEVNNR